MKTAQPCLLVVAAVAASALMLTVPHTASAQAPDQTTDRVRQLYTSADYEQALALLGSHSDPVSQQYRALCLLALGRQTETETAVEALVSSSPGFTVSEEDMPPRFVALLNRTRRAQLPAILRRLFAEAREQYQAQAYDRALPRFEQVVALASSADVREVEAVADVRLLAEGFIDLAKARPGAAATAPAKPEAPTPAAAAATSVAVPVTMRKTTPPVVRRKVIPPWPADAGPLLGSRDGAVRVQINSSGRVTSATIVKSVNLRYDLKLLEAARFWEYTPATINGSPVESESVVDIRVDPPPAR